MKRALAFFVVLACGVAALYYSQRRREPTPVSANAVLDVAADVQRDLTRVPMRFTRLSDAEEIAAGNELASRYSAGDLSAEEQATEKYLQKVGANLALHAHRRLPYSFHLLPDGGMMNAFSLPGGHVFIGKGMLDVMITEDELANVLGHEIEHVDHYHCAERVQMEAQLRHLGVIGALAQIPLQVWEAGYSKDQEFEADREGIRLAVSAGYSPYGAVTMFERFSKLHDEYVIHARSPEQELSQLAIQSLNGYFRSHPQMSERIAQANRLIAQEHWESRKAQKAFRVEYQVKNGEYIK